MGITNSILNILCEYNLLTCECWKIDWVVSWSGVGRGDAYFRQGKFSSYNCLLCSSIFNFILFFCFRCRYNSGLFSQQKSNIFIACVNMWLRLVMLLHILLLGLHFLLKPVLSGHLILQILSCQTFSKHDKSLGESRDSYITKHTHIRVPLLRCGFFKEKRIRKFVVCRCP